MMFRSLQLCLVCAAVLLVSSAVAHQQKTSVSVVQLRPHLQMVEITHRFNIHDVEHALKLLGYIQFDITSNIKAQEAFSSYVYQRFSIRYNQERPMVLKPVGFEIEGNAFWIYQEATIDPTVEKLEVANNVLQEIWSEQSNLVNFEGFGEIQSLRFVDQDQWQNILFKSP